MSKTAIVIFSDPQSGSEEALGRLFNALFLTLELRERGDQVALIFQGTGARWPAELVKPGHPASALYNSVRDSVVGICGGCADVFGATSEAAATGLKLVRERVIPGTTGVLDLSGYLHRGYQLVTF